LSARDRTWEAHGKHSEAWGEAPSSPLLRAARPGSTTAQAVIQKNSELARGGRLENVAELRGRERASASSTPPMEAEADGAPAAGGAGPREAGQPVTEIARSFAVHHARDLAPRQPVGGVSHVFQPYRIGGLGPRRSILD
jgi:hypothetical protein